MDIGNNWDKIKKVFEDANTNTNYHAIATVNEDGSPHITPIGSLFLRDDKTGFYLEELPVTMTRNFETDKRVCVMAINSDKTFWGMSLLRGKFKTPPGVRLMGTVKERRVATDDETAMWKKRVKKARRLKGYEILWSKMGHVREIEFDSFEPVHCSSMTDGLWEE